jgi:hypothetical protein
MRVGENPTKGGKLIEREFCSHRIIIPLHVPHELDYYKDAYQIFLMGLESIIKTSATKVKISVISNKCSDNVNQRLLDLFTQKKINELIIEEEGIGKINSVLKALRTIDERLVTITDADVLFTNGWEEAVVEVFENFPKAGAVCPTPVFRKQMHLTTNIWVDYFFSNKLKFLPVKNTDAMEKFAQSIGWTALENRFKDVIACIESKNGTKAVLGCSHFVATYKTEIFKTIPKENSIYKIEGDSEFLYTDLPVLKMDGYRLATYNNYTFHIGNKLGGWVSDVVSKIKYQDKTESNYSFLKTLYTKPIRYLLIEKGIKKFFIQKKMQEWLMQRKGLTKEQLKTFWY